MRQQQIVVASPPERPTGLRFDTLPDPKLGPFTALMRWWCRINASPVGMNRRRGASIHAYVGLNGSGKTLRMVADAATELAGLPWECYEEDHRHNDPQYDDRGEFAGFGPDAVHEGYVRVLSTVRLLDPDTGKLHPRYERFSDWQQLDGLEHAVVLMDEIAGVAHSRDSSSLPHDIMTLLQQLRKGEVRVCWSAPHWARADKLIREVTSAITVCVGLSPDRGSDGLWRPNRRFFYRTYDTVDFDEWTAGRVDKLEPMITEHVWGPGSLGFKLYNTKQKVTRLGHSNDAGVCVACGGTRRRQECGCDDYQTRRHAARVKPSTVQRT